MAKIIGAVLGYYFLGGALGAIMGYFVAGLLVAGCIVIYVIATTYTRIAVISFLPLHFH